MGPNGPPYGNQPRAREHDFAANFLSSCLLANSAAKASSPPPNTIVAKASNRTRCFVTPAVLSGLCALVYLLLNKVALLCFKIIRRAEAVVSCFHSSRLTCLPSYIHRVIPREARQQQPKTSSQALRQALGSRWTAVRWRGLRPVYEGRPPPLPIIISLLLLLPLPALLPPAVRASPPPPAPPSPPSPPTTPAVAFSRAATISPAPPAVGIKTHYLASPSLSSTLSPPTYPNATSCVAVSWPSTTMPPSPKPSDDCSSPSITRDG